MQRGARLAATDSIGEYKYNHLAPIPGTYPAQRLLLQPGIIKLFQVALQIFYSGVTAIPGQQGIGQPRRTYTVTGFHFVKANAALDSFQSSSR